MPDINFTLKCPELAMIAPSFIGGEMLFIQHIFVAGNSDKYIANTGGSIHRHHLETLQHCFQRGMGSTSVTTTMAPIPRARMAKPRPHQP
jgi:hypothetical protein